MVKADPSQLQQVFLNLFNNAIDAIIERYGSSGGRLEVAVEINENGSTGITVSDNGAGITRYSVPSLQPSRLAKVQGWVFQSVTGLSKK